MTTGTGVATGRGRGGRACVVLGTVSAGGGGGRTTGTPPAGGSEFGGGGLAPGAWLAAGLKRDGSSGRVPHGRWTEPAWTVTTVEYASPPALTVIVVLPGLNGQNSPEWLSVTTLSSAPISGLRRFEDAGSWATKSPMSGSLEANSYSGVSRVAQAAPAH